ncbi:MAG: hypothetical protein WC505_04380 [Patescibacteria group bacterium]
MKKQGGLGFWKKATKNPELVLKELMNDDAWIIDDGTAKVDEREYDGPFLLHVPSLGKMVKIYGKVGKYEDSQKRIEEIL